MKIKSFLLLVIMFMVLLLPSTVLAADKVETYTESNGNVYELFDDNTARVILVEKQNYNTYSTASDIPSGIIGSDGEEYVVTSISENALDNITEQQDLYLSPRVAPVLETNDSQTFFKNINAIYIPLAVSYTPELNAEGYIEDNGWPKDKVKNYIITEQPIASTEVTAGAITSNDTLSVRYTIPLAGGSLVYSWHYCDQNGNIIDKENCVSDEPDLQIPMDLTYDHEKNTSKDYYFRCIVGVSGNIQEYSDVAKVTVKPGTYKVTFHYSSFEQDTLEPIVLSVNNERKLNNSDITKIPTDAQLEQYKEGAKFVGWTSDYGETVFDINDLSTITFDKNMELYPVWKTKINFDANGGKFEDGSTVFTTYISNFGIFDEEPLEPSIDGDEFLGFFYEKSGGNLYEGETIAEETTLYAQWELYNAEENESTDAESDIDKDIIQDTTTEPDEKDETPKTGNDLQIIENILIVGLVAILIFVTIKIMKK